MPGLAGSLDQVSLGRVLMSRLTTLKVRSEFLAVRGGVRASVPSCLIEARKRRPERADRCPDDAFSVGKPASCAAAPRFGFTVTKKLGNAVTRNRIRRRLKAAIGGLAAEHANADYDYVVVARAAAFDRPYDDIVADLIKAFEILHRAATSRSAVRANNRPEKRTP